MSAGSMELDPAAAAEAAVRARLRAVEAAEQRGDSAVQGFYRGAVVFLTGGSGFLGKQLLEKLLRSCDIERAYVLVRDKKGQSPDERLAKMLNDPVFSSARSCRADCAARVRAVRGDVTRPRLGLAPDDWRLLADQVTVIFHCAATTTFDEQLRDAVLANVRGAQQALLLARDCHMLQSFVHVSTAYSHMTHGRVGQTIREDFYPAPMQPETIIGLVEQLSDEKLAAIKPELIKDWPNTYSFTKAIAEEAVRCAGAELPVCILRPAIVICSNLEPSPGWLDLSSVFGPSGLLLGAGLGGLHACMADDATIMSFVPVDMVNNAALVAAAATPRRRAAGDAGVAVYNVAPSTNTINWGRIDEILDAERATWVPPRAVWYCFQVSTRSRALFLLLTWLLHVPPAALADAALLLLGRKPRALKILRTVYKLSCVLSFYTCHEVHFADDELRALHAGLSATDKVLFNFDTESINWRELLVIWLIGLRKYIIKDGLVGTKKAAKRQKVLKVANYFVGALYFYLIYSLFSFVIWAVKNLLGY